MHSNSYHTESFSRTSTSICALSLDWSNVPNHWVCLWLYQLHKRFSRLLTFLAQHHGQSFTWWTFACYTDILLKGLVKCSRLPNLIADRQTTKQPKRPEEKWEIRQVSLVTFVSPHNQFANQVTDSAAPSTPFQTYSKAQPPQTYSPSWRYCSYKNISWQSWVSSAIASGRNAFYITALAFHCLSLLIPTC